MNDPKGIRRNGEFSVPSENFPGQNHIWRLSLLLQQGWDRGRKNLRRGLAVALKLLIVYAKGRIVGKNFSLKKALRAWIRIPKMFLEILFGLRSMEVVPYEAILEWEFFLHVTSGLGSDQEQELLQFKEFIFKILRDRFKKHSYAALTSTTPDLPPLIYTYSIPGKDVQVADFRLSNPVLWPAVKKALVGTLQSEKVRDEWFIEFRDRTIEELKADQSPGMTDEKREILANRRAKDEYLRRVYESLRRNQDLKSLAPNIGQVLVEQMQSVLALEESVSEYNQEYEDSQTKLESDLQSKYPIRSLIKRWIRRQLRYASEKFHQDNKWKTFELAIEKTASQGLTQSNYLFSNVYEFEKNKKPALEADLSKIQQPSRVFNWRQRIWLPRNWILTKTDTETGESVRIHPLEFGTEPYTYNFNVDDTQRFDLRKENVRQTSTKYPFWRWINFFNRCWSWTLNGMFYLLIVVPWCSPVSFRALVSRTYFYPDFTVDRSTGRIRPKEKSKTHSFMSRMRALWKHVRNSRNKFEAAPDRGFLGKSVTRPLNRFWNYVIKGAFGSVILTAAMPPICFVSSVASVIAGLTCPIWMIFVVLLFHLFCILIYDKDAPRRDSGKNRIALFFDLVVYRLLILGIIQPITATVTAGVLCPLGSVIVTIVSYIRFGIRSSWDWVMFHVLVKRFGRIPASDSFVARRVAGPGLSGNYFYQIKPEQALALLEKKIEMDELNEYEAETKRKLREPAQEFENRVSTLFGPFGGALNQHSKQYLEVKSRTTTFEAKLNAEIAKRKTALRTDLNTKNAHKIRMTARDLSWTLKVAGEILKKLYPEHVISRMGPITQGKFWKDINLLPGDWEGLGSQLFSQIFSPEFPIALEEGETRFKLEVEHIDLKGYMDQLISAEHREDLEAVLPTQAPAKQKWAAVTLPAWDGERFSEASVRGSSAESVSGLTQVVSREMWEREIAVVMALVYNRLVNEGNMEGGSELKEIPCSNDACKSLLRQLALVHR